ncbi:motility associated factor glycosyltransferase family protein [Clostridium botulinum]|nr:motility associated factor glycosyltransferase family protein [Clostridium botulinum]
MNYFNKNIKLLKKYQYKLANDILEYNKINNENFIIDTNFNNIPYLKIKNSNNEYINLTSSYDPITQSKRMCKDINFKKNRNCIISIGGGLGNHIDFILNQLNEKSILIVLEKEIGLIKQMLSVYDWSNYLEKLKIIFVSEIDEQKMYVSLRSVLKMFSYNIVHMQVVKFNILDKCYNELTKNIIRFLRNYSETFSFALGNDLDDTLVGIKNRYDNLPRYIRSVGVNEIANSNMNKYKNKPAIIVASGPSLNKNVSLLKEAVGKALILSCDGSVATLKKKGIIPDAVGSVERIFDTYEAFYKNKTFNKDIVLACPAVVRKEIVDTFDNKILSFFKNENYGRFFNEMLLNRKGIVWCGASVSHMLFGLAYSLGCNPIILVGQDLAYSEEGISHTSEAEVKYRTELKDVDVYVKGKNGKMLPSTDTWEKFLSIYNEGLRDIDRIVIDATEGGALIDGTEISTLKETINKYCNTNTPQLRSIVNSVVEDEEYEKEAFNNAILMTIDEVNTLKELENRVKVALNKNTNSSKIIKRGLYTQKELNEVYNAIDFVEQDIVKYIEQFPTLSMLFQYLIHSCASRISATEYTSFNYDSLSFNIECHNEMLKEILKYTEKAIKVFEEGLKILKVNKSI